jgi:hypothetical protein
VSKSSRTWLEIASPVSITQSKRFRLSRFLKTKNECRIYTYTWSTFWIEVSMWTSKAGLITSIIILKQTCCLI